MMDSLKRKLGPLPVWAWAIIAGIAVYYYRSKISGSVSGTGTGSVATVPPSQSPIPLAPGESVYDPNSGQLVSTPLASDPQVTGNTPDTTAASDPSSAIDALASAITAAIGAFNPGGGSGTAPNVPPPRRKPPGRKKPPTRNRRKHTLKPKPAHNNGKPRLTARTPGSKTKNTRPRSSATTRTRAGGRTTSRRGAPPDQATHLPRDTGSPGRTKRAPVAPRGRQRPTHNVVSQPTVRNRPAATHPAAKPTTVSMPAHRPSSPPPRTVRTPTRRKK